MKTSLRTLTVVLAAVAMLATGCKPENTVNEEMKNAAYVLNEGNWGGNDASITLIDRTNDKAEGNWFSNNNGRGLGDLAQDMIHYGSRLYVTVHTSNKLEVIDAITGKSVRQIDFGTRGPRYMAAADGKVYVTCYDKTVVRVDTASLSIEATCQLSGMQPEQLCIVGQNLYVCNSWQQGTGGSYLYDNSVSVVNISSFTETSKITVGTNPGKIKAIDSHRFIVACAGDYTNMEPATTLVVDVESGSQQSLSVAASNMAVYGNNIYLYSTVYDENWTPSAAFYRVDATTLQTEQILTANTSQLSAAYGINIDPSNGNIYVCNSPYGENGDVYTFKADGTLLRKVEGGVYASKVVF